MSLFSPLQDRAKHTPSLPTGGHTTHLEWLRQRRGLVSGGHRETQASAMRGVNACQESSCPSVQKARGFKMKDSEGNWI